MTRAWQTVRSLDMPPGLVPALVFGLCVALPSVGQVAKYTNGFVAAAYVMAACCFLWVAFTYVLPKVLPKLSEGQVFGIAIASFVVVVAVFAVVYPIANDPTTFGGGSDADDALDIAARELMRGNYPYHELTYLGGLLLPMPGAVLLALPFVALGYSAYQNLFWLAVLFLVARWRLKDSRSALGMFLMILAASPAVWWLVVTGIDRLSNSIYVLAAVLWLLSTHEQRKAPMPARAASAAFMGLALSSRLNYVFIVPVVFAALVRTSGWKQAAGSMAMVAGTSLAVTLPFYLLDPEGFSPLDVAGLPMFLPITAGLVALIASLFVLHGKRDLHPVTLGICAVVQAVPLLGYIAFRYAVGEEEPLRGAAYGVSFMFFGCLALWTVLEERSPQAGRLASLRPS